MATEIKVGLNLDDRLSPGLKKSLSAVDRFKRGIFSLQGVVAGLATGALALTVKRFAEQADTLGKLSQRLGVSTEALSELGFAAEQSGVRVESLNIGLQRAIRRFEEFAATGKGPAADAIQALGLEEAVRSGQSFEQLLPQIAEGLRKLDDQSERVRVGFKLFDSEGVALIQLFQQGSREIEKLRQEARELGITISQGTAEDAAEFNDALNRLTKSVQGFTRNAVEPLLPPLTTLFDLLSKIAQIGSKGLNLSRADIFTPEVERALAELFGLESLAGRARDIEVGGAVRRRQEAAAAQRLRDQIRAEILQGQSPFFIGPEIPPSFLPGAPFVGPQQGIPVDESEVDRLRRLAEETKRAADDAARLRSGFAGVADSIAFLRQRTTDFEIMRQSVDALGFAIESNMTNALADFITGTKSAKEAFREFAAQMVQDLARIIARMIVLKTLQAAVGFISPAAGVAASTPTQLIPEAALSFGHGGIADGPRSGFPAVLHGREAVIPLPPGNRAIPVEMRGGGRPVQINFLVQATDAQSFTSQFETALSARQEVVGNVVINELRRRGLN